MKLKILPSSLRYKKRYIAFEIISELSLNRRDIINIIWDSCLKVYGECNVSKFRIWVTKLWCPPSLQHGRVMAGLLRCKRGEEKKVISALSLVSQYKGKRVVIHTLGVSGTMRAAMRKFILPLLKNSSGKLEK
ncbi:Ribonuclease P-related protein [Methanothermus fervidus DSM 2088]|uniref:Ribonuclease P protein component 2 n=1 Tax=Methanothermus fervidus (strain ATCC 43054 / DSM 2088 / JCM 10308 / V24 S) TaxID=523846 RepID=E3GZ87_METFV|nr:Rpp14/Pop5 family protein [Methanothermus fervidus]ADP77619.1 Ribonuclease P-related protein [Methanothermus fervidus DSM 2088]